MICFFFERGGVDFKDKKTFFFLGGGVPPGYLHPYPISDKKSVIFHTYFQTRAQLFERRLALTRG